MTGLYNNTWRRNAIQKQNYRAVFSYITQIQYENSNLYIFIEALSPVISLCFSNYFRLSFQE